MIGKTTGQHLLSKADDILAVWIADVGCDLDAEFSTEMTYEAIRSKLPWLVEVIAASLDCVSTVEAQAFLQQATRSVELDFDPTEMLRELKLLRQAVLRAFCADDQSWSCDEFIRVSAAIDTVFNHIIVLSMEQHSAYQSRQIKSFNEFLLSRNRELLSLLQAQKENAAHLAHELKNPLNAIISFSSLIMRNRTANSPHAIPDGSQKGNNQERIFFERIHENGQQMLHLISNMLEVSRQESAQPMLNVEPTDVTELIKNTIHSLEPLANEKKLTLSVEFDRAPLQIYTDRLRLHQIVVNLVSNAIRYTEYGGVSIRCSNHSEKQWILSVEDTGIGMTAHTQQRIFEPHFREKSVRQKPVRENLGTMCSVQSNGLGLAIVEKLVQLLQGKIEFTSQIEKGSTFIVIFPNKVGCWSSE